MTSILIIEDDTQISRLINSTLTVEGYHCESALDGQEGADRIRGLRMGADDYLSKPFQIGELLARVETVLRRTKQIQDKITIGDVTIDPVSRLVFKCGKQVDLTVKEFDLLIELVRNKNVALSRARLYEAVWEEEYSGETRTLDSHIQRLRKKLDWNDRIVTVFRIGYRLEVHK